MNDTQSAGTMDGMKADAPPFTRNLKKLVDRDSAKTIADRAKLDVQRIHDYLYKGTVPRVDTCIAIADAADVPVAWLVSNEGDEPIPSSQLAIVSFPDLARELRRRYYHDARELLALYDRAESIDWPNVWEDVSKLEPGDPLPEQHRDALEVAAKLGQFPHAKLQGYDLTSKPGSVTLSEFPDAASIDFDALNSTILRNRTLRLRSRRFGDVVTRLASLQWTSKLDAVADYVRRGSEVMGQIIDYLENRSEGDE